MSTTSWHERAGRLAIDGRAFIDGLRVEARSGARMGKPIRYSLSVDVQLAQNCIRWYGEAIDKIYDQVAPTGADSLALVTREPVGVVAAVIPWARRVQRAARLRT